MPIRLTALRRAAPFALVAAIAIAAAALAQPTAPPQSTPSAPPSAPADAAAREREPPLARLEPIRLQLEQIETAARRENASDDALAQMRASLDPLRETLRAETGNLEQRLADADARLKQLGPQPAAGAPPENETISAERARIEKRRGEIDAATKQARLLALRVDAAADRITERRRTLFAKELFVRTSSALDPAFWTQAVQAIPGQIRGFILLGRSWSGYALENGGIGGIMAAFVTLIALLGAGLFALRWFRGRGFHLHVDGTRFSKARVALLTLLRIGITAPAMVVAAVLVYDSFGLMPARIIEIGFGLVAAVAVACFGRAVAVALFAPNEPERRLPRLDNARARLLADHLTFAGRLLGIIVFLNVLQRAVVAPVSTTVATSAVLAAIILAPLIHLLLRLSKHEVSPGAEARGQWMRGAGWIVVAALAIALATGYIGFAAFLAGRLLVMLATFGALYILLAFVDSLFGEVLTGDTARGRAVAAFFGLKPRSIELIGTLLSAVTRLLLVLIVIVPLLGPWGLFAPDFFGVVRDAALGFRIGDITISLGAILTAFALVFIGVLATRAAQRWLQTRFLPRTNLEPSLQHSVSVIFGYLGVVIAVALALAELGIDLQKITLVAGALSIGIGFGLQSVVSNFVSGLILLTERPIRVGDMIVVKGEEGFVRRIRVRATEIETFERASVIVPNSELITTVVKNWTHANTLGRILIKVGIAYDSDVEKARDILLAIAREHPQILQNPAPVALLAGFGDSAVNFELIAVVGNVGEAGQVKSDVHFAILKRFREANIVIPYPRREVVWTGERPAGTA